MKKIPTVFPRFTFYTLKDFQTNLGFPSDRNYEASSLLFLAKDFVISIMTKARYAVL